MTEQTTEISLEDYDAEQAQGVTLDAVSAAGGTRGWIESGPAVEVGA